MREVYVQTVEVVIKDFASLKLLLINLRMIADEMRVSADPYAARLEAILDTWADRIISDGGPEDGA